MDMLPSDAKQSLTSQVVEEVGLFVVLWFESNHFRSILNCYRICILAEHAVFRRSRSVQMIWQALLVLNGQKVTFILAALIPPAVRTLLIRLVHLVHPLLLMV